MIAAVVSEFETFCANVTVDDDVSSIVIEKKLFKENIVTIPNTQDAVGEFVEQFRTRVLQRYIATPKEQGLAEYVLVECMDNAWEHGNEKDPTRDINLLWSISENCLTVSVEDQGDGFLVEIPKAMPPLSNPRGRGLYTLQDIAEELWYNRKGNMVTFKIARGRKKS